MSELDFFSNSKGPRGVSHNDGAGGNKATRLGPKTHLSYTRAVLQWQELYLVATAASCQIFTSLVSFSRSEPTMNVMLATPIGYHNPA
jgi:hypothetical protein